MPFDAPVAPAEVAAPTKPPSLAETLRICGIQPVPDTVAKRHMDAEVKKRPADLFYVYQDSLPTTRVLWIVAGLVSVSGAFLPNSNAAVICLGMLLFLAFTGWKFRLFHETVRGRAYWEDSFDVVPPRDTPSPILDRAYEVKWALRDVVFVTSRLQRPNAIVADPVLWAECGNERVCLGIWDKQTVIAAAARI